LVLDLSGTLAAFDPESGAELWSRKLTDGKIHSATTNLAATAGGLYVAYDDKAYGIDTTHGAILWSGIAIGAGEYPPLVIGDDVITRRRTLERIQVRTGTQVWEDGKGGGDAVLLSNVLIGSESGYLVGREVANGHILWQLPLHEPGSTYSHPKNLTDADGESVWIFGQPGGHRNLFATGTDPVICVTRNGHETRFNTTSLTGTPAFINHDFVITADQTRILGYAHGSLPPLPTGEMERHHLAEQLVSRFELLDTVERAQLTQLAPYAFQPLLAKYVQWSKADDATLDGKDHNRLPIDRLAWPDLYSLLYSTFQKEDTKTMASALTRLDIKGHGRSGLEGILQEKGDPASYIPVLVSSLHGRLKEPPDSTAVTIMAHSSQPEAVSLMLEALRNPKAAPDWRWAAFLHLAGTGGDEGIRAVRDARQHRAPLKPWYDRIDCSHLYHDDILSVKSDAKGRTWMLFRSGVLGNYGDLFIAEKRGSHWARPIFTGVCIGATIKQPAASTFRGIPIDRLISTEWIRIFPDDESIRRDTDGDGLTDLVEQRLGTDPNRAHTYSDELSDATDPCPNAPLRTLGDTEKIIAACVEAKFYGDDLLAPAGVGVAPALIFVPGIQPFKLNGYPAPLLWETPDNASNLESLSPYGLNYIYFQYPDMKQRADGEFIRYDADHKTAHTIINRYSGGLNAEGDEITLLKIGDEWFVIELVERWVA
jgi:hypothetical protein